MLVLHVVATILGAALVLSTLLSAIKTVILPRSAGSLVTRAVFLTTRRVAGAQRIHDAPVARV